MKIASLIAALVATVALTALGQEGVVQDVKHGAKKAGETIKDGLETVGEKTKETAKTVGKKTKETAETVGEKTKETGETVARKTRNRRWHGRKSIRDYSKDPPQVPAIAPAKRRPKPRKNRRQIATQIRRHRARHAEIAAKRRPQGLLLQRVAAELKRTSQIQLVVKPAWPRRMTAPQDFARSHLLRLID